MSPPLPNDFNDKEDCPGECFLHGSCFGGVRGLLVLLSTHAYVSPTISRFGISHGSQTVLETCAWMLIQGTRIKLGAESIRSTLGLKSDSSSPTSPQSFSIRFPIHPSNNLGRISTPFRLTTPRKWRTIVCNKDVHMERPPRQRPRGQSG